jgi:hypothetical protein
MPAPGTPRGNHSHVRLLIGLAVAGTPDDASRQEQRYRTNSAPSAYSQTSAARR